MTSRPARLCLLAGSLLALLPAAPAAAGARFEIGMGGGTDPYGSRTRQILLAPAIATPLSGGGTALLRVEADLQIIAGREQTLVAGLAPFFRLSGRAGEVRPFLELGMGVNLTSSDNIEGRAVGGPLIFSTMPGAGIAFPLNSSTVSLSYRFRHISNSRLYRHNAGFNGQYLMLSMAL